MNRIRCIEIAAAAWIALLLATSPARAAWQFNGTPLAITGSTHYFPIATGDGAGGAFLTWGDDRNSAISGRDIYLQRVTPGGDISPGWPANGLQLTGAGEQGNPVICGDGAGGCYVAWDDQLDVYLQRITSSGAPAAGWPAGGIVVCNAAGGQGFSHVCPDASGGAFVAWTDARNTGQSDIYLQHVSSNGAVVVGWPANGLAVCSDLAQQQDIAIDADGAGGVFVAWDDYRAMNWDVYANRIQGDGTRPAGWNANGNVVCAALGPQTQIHLMATGGGALLVWLDGRVARELFGSYITGSGTIGAGWHPTGEKLHPSTSVGSIAGPVSDGAGGAFIDFDADLAFRIQRVTTSATFPSPWTISGVTLYQAPAGTVIGAYPTIAPDGQGGAIASWPIEVNNWTYSRILAQRVAADGSIPAFWPPGGYALCDSTPAAQTPTSTTSLTGSAIVAWDDIRGVYAMRTGLPNLAATFVPPGWTTPLVAKNFAGNPHGAPSAVLDGNASTTWVDEWFHETVLESGPLTTVQTRLELDGESIEDLSFFTPTNTPEQDIPLYDRGPFAVRGGRHTVRQTIDWPNAWAERDETDNSFQVQFAWSPLLCTPGIATNRGAPPAPGSLALPNSDGFQFSHNRSTAWVSAIAPLNPNDDYDLYVYSDYAGSQSGFSVVAGSSIYGNNAVDFVVGNRSGTPATLYPATVRYSVAGGGGNCAVDQSQAAGRQASGAYAAWIGQTLGALRLADVYEADLVAGTTYEFMLRRTAGTSDMLCAVFSPVSGTIAGRNAALGTSPLTTPLSRLVYTATATGPHPIVVYRNMGTGATTPVTYDLIWGNYANVGVTQADVPTRLELSGAYPNPIRDGARLRLALPRESEVRLEVLDTAGRRIRELEHGVLAAGRYERSWDARDARGARVGGGVYWLRLRTVDQELRRKVVVVP